MPIRLAAALLAAALAGCGGGVWLGFGNGFDDAPSVDLAVSPEMARVGETVRLVAAASDDFGVDDVAFYELDADGRERLLGTDASAPYQLDTPLPATPLGVVRFFARATDDVGQRSDSAVVSVTVVR